LSLALMLATVLFFLFNSPPPTDIYTLSLHDALPISRAHDLPAAGGAHGRQDPGRERARQGEHVLAGAHAGEGAGDHRTAAAVRQDRKSTRLNSSHDQISYAVFCLKKKKTQNTIRKTK